MNRLLISTFDSLLDVELGSNGQPRRVRTVHNGWGIYFGLAKRGRRVLVVERNEDVHLQTRIVGEPTNTIRVYKQSVFGKLARTKDLVSSDLFDNLHQIVLDGDAILATSGKPPFLVRHTLQDGRSSGLSIANAVPKDLVRTVAESEDLYHFNSITIEDDRLHVLAHNWDRPSFVITMSRAAARQGLVEPLGLATGLGSQCHDILRARDALWTLDSGGAALVRIEPNGDHTRFPLDCPDERPFPRGMARRGDQLIVAYGLWSKTRPGRAETNSFITIFDPLRERFVATHKLGQHGNTCAVLVM